MRASEPSSVEGIEKYLGSGMIRGIGPAYARKLVRAFGDKVMQIENDYDEEACNGDIGRVVDVDADAGELVARFDGRDHVYGFGELDTLVPAYVATVHKNPGLGASGGGHSHADAALRHAAAEPALHRGTRGKRLVVLVGQKRAVAIAVRNISGRRR